MPHTADKIERLDTALRNDFTEVFAVPGSHTMIDAVHPETGRSMIFGETLEQIRARYPNAVQMPYEDWRQEQITRQHTPIAWQPISAERYHEMLDVLPPIAFTPNGFMVSEPWDHDHANGQPRYAAFIIRGSQYLTSSRPMTRAEFKEYTR